jgi:hypothetical protein
MFNADATGPMLASGLGFELRVGVGKTPRGSENYKGDWVSVRKAMDEVGEFGLYEHSPRRLTMSCPVRLSSWQTGSFLPHLQIYAEMPADTCHAS